MLRALGRLLRPGGRTAFTTIVVTPGLGTAERRRASRAGPRAVASSSTPRRLLGTAGYTAVEEVDITPAFLLTAAAWLRETTREEAELAAAVGRTRFDERQAERRTMLAAIEDGLLRRTLLVARRPG